MALLYMCTCVIWRSACSPTPGFSCLLPAPTDRVVRRRVQLFIIIIIICRCWVTKLETLALPERYIVSKCHRLVEDVTKGLQGYDMGDAGKNIYEFLWDEYADW